jgi:hypothetical protein
MSNAHGFSGIVFWNYDPQIKYEDFLLATSLAEMTKKVGIYVEISFDKFLRCYWDEQIFVMSEKNYNENGYAKRLNCLRGDGGVFFSFVIDGRIVLTGLNRIVNGMARTELYDDSDLPRFVYESEKDGEVYFRLSFSTVSYTSIWDQANRRKLDVGVLFVDDVLNYFEKKGEIIRGRFDILDLIY